MARETGIGRNCIADVHCDVWHLMCDVAMLWLDRQVLKGTVLKLCKLVCVTSHVAMLWPERDRQTDRRWREWYEGSEQLKSVWQLTSHMWLCYGQRERERERQMLEGMVWRLWTVEVCVTTDLSYVAMLLPDRQTSVKRNFTEVVHGS